MFVTMKLRKFAGLFAAFQLAAAHEIVHLSDGIRSQTFPGFELASLRLIGTTVEVIGSDIPIPVYDNVKRIGHVVECFRTTPSDEHHDDEKQEMVATFRTPMSDEPHAFAEAIKVKLEKLDGLRFKVTGVRQLARNLSGSCEMPKSVKSGDSESSDIEGYRSLSQDEQIETLRAKTSKTER